MRNNEQIGQNIRLKYLFAKRIGGAWGQDLEGEEGIVCLRAADIETEKVTHKIYDLTRRVFSQDEISNKGLQPGDLIIEKSGGGENQPVGRIAFFQLNEPALCSNFMELLRPDTRKVLPQFAAFSLYSLWLKRVVTPSIKQTTGIQNLDIADYLDNEIFLPPIPIQEQIINYLKNELHYIDNLIIQKEKLIKLLSEKRQALITQAVTRGLDSTIKLKNSGVAWLGDVPEHWEIERTKWLFKERNERSETGEEELLTVSHITGVTLRSEKDVNMFEAESNEGYKIAKKGDLVINTLWAWMGAMGVSKTYGIVSPAYHVYEPLNRLNSAYVDSIVRLPIFANEVTRYSKGVWSSRLRLYPEGLYDVFFPIPPIEEQNQIAEFLKNELSKINTIITVAEKSIELLRERRTALISAAVTGQIKQL